MSCLWRAINMLLSVQISTWETEVRSVGILSDGWLLFTERYCSYLSVYMVSGWYWGRREEWTIGMLSRVSVCISLRVYGLEWKNNSNNNSTSEFWVRVQSFEFKSVPYSDFLLRYLDDDDITIKKIEKEINVCNGLLLNSYLVFRCDQWLFITFPLTRHVLLFRWACMLSAFS